MSKDETFPPKNHVERAGEPHKHSLKKSVVNGAGWTFANKTGTRLLGLLHVLVVARLLTPDDFGLFAIVMLVITTVDTFSNTGFYAALIQRKEKTEEFLDTAWTIQFMRGIAMAAVLYLLAPPAAWLFHQPRVIALLRVCSIAVALRGFVNIGMIYLLKDFLFRRSFFFEFSVQFTRLLVSTTIAFVYRSVWALVLGWLAESIIRLVLSYVVHPYRPKIRLDRNQAKELFRFGRWVLSSSVFTFLAGNIENAVLGRMLGAASLGIYQMAHRLAHFASADIADTVSAVTFPAYSKMQDQLSRMRGAYFKVASITIFIAAPAALGMAGIAPVFVSVVLGREWVSAIIPLQILCVCGLTHVLGATGAAMFYGSGMPKLQSNASLMRLGLILVAIVPATHYYGVIGTTIAVSVAMFASDIYTVVKVTRVVGTSYGQLLVRILDPVIAGAGMFVLVSGFTLMLKSTPANLLLLTAIGAVTYAALISFMFLIRGRNSIINVLRTELPLHMLPATKTLVMPRPRTE